MNKILFVLLIGVILFVSLSNYTIPNTYADDMIIKEECNSEGWQATITDAEGYPLTNVQVNTLKKISSSSPEESFITDDKGMVSIPFSSITGFAKVSKGGYNDRNIIISCEKIVNEQNVNFQKQNTDIYIAKHFAFAGGWFIAGYGDANSIIAGDIVNLSDYPLTDIVISVKTFRNEILEDVSSWHPIKKILRPGEASPFVIQPLLAGFDDYEIWINDYKFSDKLPKKPSVDAIDLDVQRNFEQWDTYTIKCTDSGVYPDDLSFLLIWYNESGYMYSIEFFSPEYPDKDDCRLNGNKTSIFPYFDIPSDDSFEFFVIEGPQLLLIGEETRKLNPAQYSITQSETYSAYYPDSLRPKYMDGITKIQSFLTNSNLDQEKSTVIVEKTPETNLPELGTYNILVQELPKNWEKDYGHILDESLEFWEENFDELKFNRVDNWEDADFTIEWASIFSDGLLGYYGCCDDFGANKVVITLGYFDDENNWILTDPDYAKEILKHEIGHAIGLKHTFDADDIMYAYIYDYEKWQNLDKIKKEFVIDESKLDIPNWIRNNAKWWSEGKINDEDFVSGVQFLIKERIMQIPQTAKAPLSTGSKEIPSWIKNNADWWSQGLISDDDFIKGIQYLVEQGIIKV